MVRDLLTSWPLSILYGRLLREKFTFRDSLKWPELFLNPFVVRYILVVTLRSQEIFYRTIVLIVRHLLKSVNTICKLHVVDRKQPICSFYLLFIQILSFL